MLIVFFDAQGVVHKDFVPVAQTVSFNFYIKVLVRLRIRVRYVRRNLVDIWVLHYNNVSTHSSLFVREGVVKTTW